MNKEQKQQIDALWITGMRKSDIARRMGLSKDSIFIRLME